MISASALGVSYLTDDDELPHVPQGAVPGWSENYLSQAFSPGTGVGVYLHRSRTPFDPQLWREIAVVYLPDDRLLVAKTFRHGEADGAATGLVLRCDEPWTCWTNRFRGAGRMVSGAALRAGPVTDGLHAGFELELTYRAMSPAWDLGVGQRDQVWANDHYEQACRVSGVLRLNGSEMAIDGTGLRDHSWGPRDLSAMGRHVWLHGQFETGRSFMVVGVRTRADEPALVHAVVTDETSVTVVEVAAATPFVASLDQALDGYEIELVTASGLATVTAEVLHALPVTFAGANEMVLGVAPGPGATHVSVEAQTRFRWNGEVGYGLSERSFLLDPDRGALG